MANFLQMLAFKNVLKYLFYSVFAHQPKCAQKGTPKNESFSHVAKHRLIKKRFAATPPFDQTFVLF